MIDVRELRIGNWVKCWGQPHTIGLVSKSEIRIEDWHYPNNVVDENTIEPLVLSPEILEKAGFEVKDYVYRMPGRGIYLSPWVNDRWMLANERNTDIFPAMPFITSLHQLQNLFYSLTGEELIIQL